MLTTLEGKSMPAGSCWHTDNTLRLSFTATLHVMLEIYSLGELLLVSILCEPFSLDSTLNPVAPVEVCFQSFSFSHDSQYAPNEGK